MGHYARLENDVVTEVIVAKADVIAQREGEWVKTSYNTIGGVYYQPSVDGNASPGPDSDQSKALRKNFASIGYTYDRDRDAFIPPRPYASWLLDSDSCLWEPPTPAPSGNPHVWNENTQSWDSA